MTKKAAFSKLPLVATAVFESAALDAKTRFIADWRVDDTVIVKAFARTVRAGGAGSAVVVVVVRRKAA